MATDVRARRELKLRLDDDLRVWYLLLQIGVPARCYGEDPAHHIHVVRNELRTLGGIVIRRVEVGAGTDSNGHYLFRFTQHKRDDSAAIRLAEAFLYGMSLAFGPTVGDHHDSLILRVPANMVRSASPLQIEDLERLEESRSPDDRSLDSPLAAISEVISTTPHRHELAWRIATVTFNNDRLFDATRFLNRSHNDYFCASSGQIREIVSDAEAVPRTASHQTDLEGALHNAFKAIEAVIGDPPRDDRKFFERLKNIGIDPQEKVGYAKKLPIYTVIRMMNDARDKRSAHGSTRQRTIHPAELVEFQACAKVIIMAALEKARGSAISA